MTRNYQIASAPFASGVAWLVNILLELHVRTTATSLQPEHWLDARGRTECNTHAYNHLRWHLPVLHDRRHFIFRPDLEVFWEHRLDLARHQDRPTILFVRDPRDAIYSFYCRHFADHEPFLDFLHRPTVWPDHFPALFGLPPADTWAFFHLYWLEMRRGLPLCVVRFEEMRDNPHGAMQTILRLLDLEYVAGDVDAALEASSFERARCASEAMARETGLRLRTARRGQVGEWKEVYSEAELAWFGGPPSEAMGRLGYAVPISEERGDLRFRISLQETRQRHPRFRGAVEHAEEHFHAGRQEAAEGALCAFLREPALNFDECLGASIALTSLVWARRIFGPDQQPAVLRRAYEVFCALHERFVGTENVQRVLSDTIRNPEGVRQIVALRENIPHIDLIEADYKGFNIVRFRDTYYALAQSLGAVDLPALESEMLAAYEADRTCLRGQSLDETKGLVDQSPRDIRLVEADYHGYNIIHYRNRYYALAQSLGPVDLLRVNDATLEMYRANGTCLLGHTLEEVRSLVDRVQGRVPESVE